LKRVLRLSFKNRPPEAAVKISALSEFHFGDRSVLLKRKCEEVSWSDRGYILIAVVRLHVESARISRLVRFSHMFGPAILNGGTVVPFRKKVNVSR
jgi:hypothetical protein